MMSSSKNTVFGVAPMSVTVPVVGGVLVLLFVMMRPEATQGLGVHERLLFWTAHVGLGVVGLAVTSRLLRPRWLRRLPLAAQLLVVGVAGALLLAPAYLLIETYVFPSPAAEADDWLDVFAGKGPVQALVAEFVELAPVFLAAWFAVNLPLLFDKPQLGGPGPGGPAEPDGGGTAAASPPEEAVAHDATVRFLERLPRAVGRDVVAISSDMHYLHVHTELGKCMIHGALRDAATSLGDQGMLVHRSHWVAFAQVTKLARQGSSLACVMSNGLRVPVSRRNRAKVTEWFGRGHNVVVLPAKKKATSAN